jgi:hypothetical protein
MAEAEMRSVPNLIRKILADHLRNRGFLTAAEEQALRLENTCRVRARAKKERWG